MAAAGRTARGKRPSMLQTCDIPRETPGRLPTPPALLEAGRAEPAPGKRVRQSVQLGAGQPCGDEAVVGGEGAPQLVRVPISGLHGFCVQAVVGQAVSEGDTARCLGQPGRRDTEARGQVSDGGAEAGGVGGEPAVERFSGDGLDPDRYPPVRAGDWRGHGAGVKRHLRVAGDSGFGLRGGPGRMLLRAPFVPVRQLRRWAPCPTPRR